MAWQSTKFWGRWRVWVVLGLIILMSGVIGISSVMQFKTSPYFNLPIVDEDSYVKWGEKIAAGDILGDKVFYQDPLYPYFLGFVFSLFGRDLLAVRLLQVLMGTASIVFVFWLASKLMGKKAGLLAAAVMAAYPGLYFFELLIYKATMIVFLSAISCAIGAAVVDRPFFRWRWVALGVSLGLLSLLRGNFLAILPFVLIWSFFYDRQVFVRERFIRTGMVTLGIMIIIIPVTVRNYVVAHEWVVTTSQAGANFYIGNCEYANGASALIPFVRPTSKYEEMDFKVEAEKRSGHKLSPTEVSRFWFGESFQWIKSNPGKALSLLLYKARLMIHQYEIPDSQDLYLIRDVFVSVLWLPFLNFGILWGPALLGMFVLFRRDRRSQYCAIFALLYALSIIPFFIVARYRVAVIPAIAVFSAIAVFWIYEKWEKREIKPLILTSLFLITTLSFGLIPTQASRTTPGGLNYYMLGNVYMETGRPFEAVHWYDKALETMPGNNDIIRDRSRAMLQINSPEISELMSEMEKIPRNPQKLISICSRLEQLGQINLATDLYERAIKKEQYSVPYVYYNLGNLLQRQGRIDESIENYQRAIQLKPDFAEAYNNLGAAYERQGSLDKAMASYIQAIAHKPNLAQAVDNLNSVKRKKGIK